jgi:hypothetical protein
MEPNCNAYVSHNIFCQGRGLACISELENYGGSRIAAGMATNAGQVSNISTLFFQGGGWSMGGDHPIPIERKTRVEPSNYVSWLEPTCRMQWSIIEAVKA